MCSGTPVSTSTCTTGTWSRSPTASTSRWSGPPAPPGCGADRCRKGEDLAEVEKCYWETLLMVRGILEKDADTCRALAGWVTEAKARLVARGRAPRPTAPDVERIYLAADPDLPPATLGPGPGGGIALREQLGKALGHLNRASGGAILIAAADLLGSAAISMAAVGFPEGFLHVLTNPDTRTLSVGGVWEDGLSCVLSGL